MAKNNKANLSEEDSKIIRMQNHPSKQQEKLKEVLYSFSDNLDNLDEKDPSSDDRA